MAHTTYKEKRNLKESPEPTGGKPDIDQLRYVIQKHDARRMHYDFRLVMEGVLKTSSPNGKATKFPSKLSPLLAAAADKPFDKEISCQKGVFPEIKIFNQEIGWCDIMTYYLLHIANYNYHSSIHPNKGEVYLRESEL